MAVLGLRTADTARTTGLVAAAPNDASEALTTTTTTTTTTPTTTTPAGDEPAKTAPVAKNPAEARARAAAQGSAMRASLDAKLPTATGKIAPEALDATRKATRAALLDGLANKADAVELTRSLQQAAADAIAKEAPDATPQDRADAAMAAASYMLLGGKTIMRAAPVDAGTTSVMKYAKQMGALDHDPYVWVPDATKGEGNLEPRFSDHTDGQAFHCGFFQLAGYIAAGSVTKTAMVTGAAVYHETLDPEVWGGQGSSRADYVASIFSATAGAQMKAARDRGEGDTIPAMTVGLLGKQGTQPPNASPIAQRNADQVRSVRDNWANRVLVDDHPIVNGMIGTVALYNWLHGTTTR